MEIGGEDKLVIGAGNGKRNWYAGRAISGKGTDVVMNYLVADESELTAVGHAANIVNDTQTFGRATRIGTEQDYRQFD